MSASGTSAAMGKIEIAHQLYREGRYVEALGFYTEALTMAKTKGQKIALRSNRAACYLKLHEFRKAADECSAVLELDHQHTGALMLRAQTLVTLKEYQSALFDVSILMELNPSSEVYKNLQARLRTQLSLAPIPESEEEMSCEDEQANDEEHTQKTSAQVLTKNNESQKEKDSMEVMMSLKNAEVNTNKKTQQGRDDIPFRRHERDVFSKKTMETNTIRVKNFDKPAELQNDKSESARGVCVMAKKNGVKSRDEQDKKSESAVAPALMENKAVSRSTDVQGKESQFPVAEEANMVSKMSLSTKSADVLNRRIQPTAEEASIFQKERVDSLAEPGKKNEFVMDGADVMPKCSANKLQDPQNQKSASVSDKEVDTLQRKNGDKSTNAQEKGWKAIPKPKGHSGLDYSRWDRVEDDSSEDEDEEEEDEQPHYRFRVRTVGVRPVN